MRELLELLLGCRVVAVLVWEASVYELEVSTAGIYLPGWYLRAPVL